MNVIYNIYSNGVDGKVPYLYDNTNRIALLLS